MADDDLEEMWDNPEFLATLFQLTEAAGTSSSTQQQQLPFRPPPPISYSPPRELSQRVIILHNNNNNNNNNNVDPSRFNVQFEAFSSNAATPSKPKEFKLTKGFNNVPAASTSFDCHMNGINPRLRHEDKSFDCQMSGINPQLRHEDKSFDCQMSGVNPQLHHEDKSFDCQMSEVNPQLRDKDSSSKQQEIDRLKEELGRVSNMLTNLEQECSELKKDREKNEKHLRLALPVNGSKDAEAICTKKSNMKYKDPIEEHSLIPATKGAIPCKGVGVQTEEHVLATDLTIKKSLSVSRKLASIWEPLSEQQPRVDLVSKLFVACEVDLQFLFGCLGLNIPSTKATTTMTPMLEFVDKY